MTDISTWPSDGGAPNLDPRFTVIADESRLTLERLARRFTTPRGTLPEDLKAGFDLRQFASAKIDGKTLSRLKSGIEAEALRDEAVRRARVSVVQDSAASTLTIAIQVESSTGPFELVLEVTAVSVDLLNLD